MTDEPKEQVKQFGVGDTIPHNMLLNDAQNKPYPLLQHFGKTTLIFYFLNKEEAKCQEMLKSIQQYMPEFEKNQISIVGMSPESSAKLTEIQTEYKLTCPLLSDDTIIAGRDLGIASWKTVSDQDTISAHRALIWVDASLRVRAWVLSPQSVDTELKNLLIRLPELQKMHSHAPVLGLPGVFEPHLCQDILQLFRQATSEGKQALSAETQKACQDAVDRRIGSRIVPYLYSAFRYQPKFREPPRLWKHNTLPLNQIFRTDMDPSAMYREYALMVPLNYGVTQELTFLEYGAANISLQPGDALVFSCHLWQRLTQAPDDLLWYVTFFYTQEQPTSTGTDHAPASGSGNAPSDDIF